MSEATVHRLVPEAPDVVPTVGVEAVWREVVAAIERSPGRDWLFANYGEKEVATGKKHTDRLRDQETAVAILNICLRHNLFTPRIHFGGRFYKVPADAFVPRFDSGDGVPNADATTWSKGVLHRLDTTVPFEGIADGGFALLLTESEFDVVRRQLQLMIAEGDREQRIVDRDHILDRAFRGEISAREADAEAERLRLDPLQARPPRDRFDPRERPAWTLPMVLAWIAWRDYEEVRAWDSDYRNECWHWDSSEHYPNGRRLVRRRPATVFEFQADGYLQSSERERGETDRPFDPELGSKAKAELWRALQENFVIANGIARGGAARRDIPAIEWVDLETRRDETTRQEYVALRHMPREPAYDDVRLFRAQVIAYWPDWATGAEELRQSILAMNRTGTTLPRPSRTHDEPAKATGVIEAADDPGANCAPSGPRALKVSLGDSWRMWPGERMGNWMKRPEVEDEANRRRLSQTKAAFADALISMGKECGAALNRNSILAAMRPSKSR